MPRIHPDASAPARAAALALMLLVATGCASARPRGVGAVERGMASWYGPGFDGRQTASGETYDMHAPTAAHRTLPFGTLVEVRNLSNGITTQVRINDRGPFKKNRIVDLSQAAARAIEMIGPGTALVELRVVALGRSGVAWLVQAGAFQELALAEALRDELAAEHPEARVASGSVWHRVQIGSFSERRDAERLRARLERAGYAALVVASPGAPAP